MTFQKPIEKAIKAAIAAKKQNNKSGSTRIFQGKRLDLGTGGMFLALRTEIMELLAENDRSNSSAHASAPRNVLNDDFKYDMLDGFNVNNPTIYSGQDEQYFEGGDMVKQNMISGGLISEVDFSQNLCPRYKLPKIIPIENYLVPWLNDAVNNAILPKALPALKGMTIKNLIKNENIKISKTPLTNPNDPKTIPKDIDTGFSLIRHFKKT